MQNMMHHDAMGGTDACPQAVKNDDDDDNDSEGGNDDDIGALGGAFEWEFGFALGLNFEPTTHSTHGSRISFWGGETV